MEAATVLVAEIFGAEIAVVAGDLCSHALALTAVFVKRARIVVHAWAIVRNVHNRAPAGRRVAGGSLARFAERVGTAHHGRGIHHADVADAIQAAVAWIAILKGRAVRIQDAAALDLSGSHTGSERADIVRRARVAVVAGLGVVFVRAAGNLVAEIGRTGIAVITLGRITGTHAIPADVVDRARVFIVTDGTLVGGRFSADAGGRVACVGNA